MRAALERNDLREVIKLTQQYIRLRSTLRPDVERQATQEITALVRVPNPVPPMAQTLAELERRIVEKDKDNEAIFRQALLLMLSAMRTEMSNRPNPVPAFLESRQLAGLDDTFNANYRLAIAATAAKQFRDAVDAGAKAIKLSANDSFARTTPDLLHSVHHIVANGYYELGRYDLAEQMMLESLDLGKINWIRPYPDLHVASKLLGANKRDGVIRYLEKSLTIPFPKSKTVIEGWLAELRSGRTPVLVPLASQ